MKTRRGISSVVGMVFAIIAIVTSIGYVTYSMNLLDQYNQSVLARNQVSLDKGNENFQVYSAKIANNKFNITVANTGNLPINVTRLWVQNASATDWDNFYSINKLVSPGSLLTNIGQSNTVYYNSANSYNLKLVTGRGNSLQFSMGSIPIKPLTTLLTFLPSTVSTNQNATVFYYVINNMTGNNLLTNLQPTLTCTAGSNSITNQYGPYPAQYPYLPNGGTAIFKWILTVSGSNHGGRFYCVANLGTSSNSASDYGYLN